MLWNSTIEVNIHATALAYRGQAYDENSTTFELDPGNAHGRRKSFAW
jgi:hypothetical protein